MRQAGPLVESPTICLKTGMAAPMHELDIRPDVAAALAAGRPVVALESTLIAHGMPYPRNLETARHAEAAVRASGGVPATIAILDGRPTVGLNTDEVKRLASETDVLKASRRDLAAAVALGRTAATTVAGTMALAEIAGIRVFATGGIGGAHREEWDISADLYELARTPVACVCAGAKSVLDIPRTLEILETLGVPVVGYGCDEFPGFYLRTTGERVSARVNDPVTAAGMLAAHWGIVIAQPIAADIALLPAEFAVALMKAEDAARAAGIRGPSVTPFLLARLAELTDGRSLDANYALVVANARLAAEIAGALAKI
jgi:pseudouridine-5'-phosphate glycosidase